MTTLRHPPDPPPVRSPAVAIFRDLLDPAAWVVKRLRCGGGGGVDLATFSGPQAEEQARSYAIWRYPDDDPVIFPEP
jgi:hypothetical protein